MKYKILLWMFLLGCLAACEDDDETGFDVPVEFRKISFEPVPGGAVMRYRLPDNMDIFGIRTRYNDAYGRQLVKEGTYLTDTLLLNGFNEARTNEPVQVTFLNNNLEESAPLEMTFSTQPAATVALFDNLTVNPFWGGFNVTYTSPSTVEGTVHIFYIGENPTTKQLDSILVGSYPITEGGDTLNFTLKQVLDELNVVVRTDDYEGNRVKSKIYQGIPALAMEMLSPDEFTFSTTASIVENEDREIGLKYLFDGKKKGYNYWKNRKEGNKGKDGYNKYGTFVAGPNAFEERFIIDFGKPRIPAILCGDAFLYYGTEWPVAPSMIIPGLNDIFDQFGAEIWHARYTSRLPCQLKVYGTNTANPETVSLSECSLLYTLDETPLFSNRLNAWAAYSDDRYGPAKGIITPYMDLEEKDLEAADPITLEMKCNYTGQSFRYIFFVVYDTYSSYRFNTDYEENASEYITFDELEVYIKMENE